MKNREEIFKKVLSANYVFNYQFNVFMQEHAIGFAQWLMTLGDNWSGHEAEFYQQYLAELEKLKAKEV